jgi:hypothetical protein
MSRVDVQAALEIAEVGSDEDANDPEWMVIREWGMELRFAEDAEQRLRQMALDHPRFRWSGKALLDQPLHLALAALGGAARDAGWRPESALLTEFDDLELLPPGTYADESLLREGTLWLPTARLGLVMSDGHVRALAWREAADVPRSTVGGVTEAQLDLCKRPDLRNYLHFWRPRHQMTTLEVMLTGVFILTLLGIGVYAWQEQQAWQSAPTIRARVTGLDPLPPGIGQKPIHVEFTDKSGVVRAGSLESAEFYVDPSAVGEEVELRYLATEPPRFKGPARVHDAGFVRSTPWVIAAVAAYGALMTAARWLQRQRRVPSAPRIGAD